MLFRSVAGGALGLALGMFGAWVAVERFGMTAIVTAPAALAAFAASAIAGLCFGLYPALRAASLSPAQALRAE